MRNPAAWIYVISGMLMLPAGCDPNDADDGIEPGVVALRVWAHAGQEAERRVLQSQAERFSRQSDAIDVALTFIPERNYNAQVQAAALADDLPDLLEFDGPYLYNYIWQQHLRPLDDLLPASVVESLLPSLRQQGTYRQRLYSVGVYDSGLGLYARESALRAIGARIPRAAADAWSIDEFNKVLRKLARLDEDGAVLDLKLNYTGEWFTYGFSPVLRSAGAGLIDRQEYRSSRGVLNSAHAVRAMRQIQHWIEAGYVDPNLDDAAFTGGRVLLSWVGHWAYPAYREAWADDLVVLPLPDFGQGSRTGQGSWNWGVNRRTPHAEAATAFLRFLLETDEVLSMSDANGAVPGTRDAVARSELYGEQGALRLFADQLVRGVAVPRPKTPGYPVITTEFQKAFQQIRNGANVERVLDLAAEEIDRDIEDNQGYRSVP